MRRGRGPDHLRIERIAGRQQAMPRGRQVPFHVSQRARGNQRGNDPGRRRHVQRVVPQVKLGKPPQRTWQVAMPRFCRRPAQQRDVAAAGHAFDAGGQAPDQVTAVLAAEHAAPALFGQPQQAERGDGALVRACS